MTGMIAFPCTTVDCDGLAYVHPRSRTDEDADPAHLICADCLDAAIPRPIVGIPTL